jgi:hypothetical protein
MRVENMSLKDSLPISNKSGHELWMLVIDHSRHEWSIFKLEGDLGTYIHPKAKQDIEIEFYASEWAAIERLTHAPVINKYEQGEFPMGGPTVAAAHGAPCPHCGTYVVTPDLHPCKDGKVLLMIRLADRKEIALIEPDKISSLIWVPHPGREADTIKITLHNGEQGMFEIHHESATALLRCLRREKL